MSDTFNNLKLLMSSAKPSTAAEVVDVKWLYDECMKVFQKGEEFNSRKMDRNLIKAARTLNTFGEYTLAREVFENLLKRTRKAGEDKLQLDSIEGLAISLFHLGDLDQAYRLVEEGAQIASTLRNDKWTVLFKKMKADFVVSSGNYPKK